jgi:16S rRNA processing protein RimM
MSRDILLGAVIAAHGLKGEVRVKTFTETPEGLAAYGPLHIAGGRALAVAAIRPTKPDEAIIRFETVDNRNDADALRGAELFVPREALPAPQAEEFYHADLIGLRAEDVQGRVVGRVAALHNFGAGDVIEIVRADGDSVLLPFTRDVVTAVEPERMILALPEDVDTPRKGFVA